MVVDTAAKNLWPRSDTEQLYESSNLTKLQLLYWVAQKLRSASILFNAILTFHIEGEVDVELFQKAFQTLLDHSDALRTVIKETNGVPQRQVRLAFPYPLEFVDLSSLPQPEATLQTWLRKRCEKVLDIEESMLDSALIKIAEARFVWYLNLHHLITDATSFFLAFKYLANFYQRFLEGESVKTIEMPPFEEYVIYERSLRTRPQQYKSQAYWLQKLSPGPDPLRFYGQRPVKTSDGVQRVSYDLGPERSRMLRKVANQPGIAAVTEDQSLYIVFAALFFVQLQRMSGNRRLGFLNPVHNRFTEVYRQTLGLLMELCPVQIEITEDDTFLSVIKKVKRETFEIMGHYRYLLHTTFRGNAFDVMLNMYDVPPLNFNRAPVYSERIHPGQGSESLVLHVNGFDSSFELHFDFHVDVFDQDRQQETVRAFVELVDDFLEDSTRAVAPVYLPAAEEWDKSDQPSSSLNDQRQVIVEQAFVPPRDSLEHRLAEIWQDILGVRQVGIKDNFFDLGGNSWLAVRLFSHIQEATGKKLPLSALLQAGTIEALASRLRQEATVLGSPVIAIQPGGSKKPFFCVHGAGGHILIFAKLAQYLKSDQPFYAFQAPGVEGEQEPLTRIEDMATRYCEAMRSVQPEGPYFLGGYSMGGMVALEMAQQLRAQGEEVALLAIIDTPVQSPRLRYLYDFIQYVGGLVGMNASARLSSFLRVRHYIIRLRRVWRLNNRDKIAFIVSKLSGDRERRPALMKGPKVAPACGPSGSNGAHKNPYVRRTSTINNEAIKAYIPKFYSGPVTLIRSQDGYKDLDKVYFADHVLGWGFVTGGEIELHIVPGDHNEMIREPHVQVLAGYLQSSLDKAQQKARTWVWSQGPAGDSG